MRFKKGDFVKATSITDKGKYSIAYIIDMCEESEIYTLMVVYSTVNERREVVDCNLKNEKVTYERISKEIVVGELL